jgi:hypothetical protein
MPFSSTPNYGAEAATAASRKDELPIADSRTYIFCLTRNVKCDCLKLIQKLPFPLIMDGLKSKSVSNRFGELGSFTSKAYIIALPLMAVLSHIIARIARWDDLRPVAYDGAAFLWNQQAYLYSPLECVYALCVFGVLVESIRLHAGRARRIAIIFTVVGLLLLVFMLPLTRLGEAKTKSSALLIRAVASGRRTDRYT